MNKVFIIIASVVFCILLSGCATSGDPNSGGLFGWSETKAKERQRGLKAALEQEEQKSDEQRLARQKLESQIAVKKRERAVLERQIDASSSDPTKAEAEQMRKLNEEIDALNDEALALMDM